ncbi:MAG: UPF0280 family protein [Syntrophobacterales bacterium]|jgi:ApbE superfamily uncharacterized protein (UPF0280 family)
MAQGSPRPQPRTYRTRMSREGLVGFRVAVKETDLMILAQRDLAVEGRDLIIQERQHLETYIQQHPEFLTTLTPWPPDPYAPPLVREMIQAATTAGVGPMAAVAGAIAARVGQALLAFTDEIIVENGGDIFMHIHHPATVSLFAGRSPLSHKVGLKMHPELQTWGVCTSSGTVGHSLSHGQADAACVVAHDTALADACATALGNRVTGAAAIQEALDWVTGLPGLTGALVVVGEHMGAWGHLELVPL